MLKSRADLMVANNMETVEKYKGHEALIIDPEKNIKKVIGKEKVAVSLLKLILSKLKR